MNDGLIPIIVDISSLQGLGLSPEGAEYNGEVAAPLALTTLRTTFDLTLIDLFFFEISENRKYRMFII
jgi:hypothetical protein